MNYCFNLLRELYHSFTKNSFTNTSCQSQARINIEFSQLQMNVYIDH